MTSRTAQWIFMVILFFGMEVYAQSEISDTIEQAKQHYIKKNFSESISDLNRALEMINQELLKQLETVFPDPLHDWRVEAPLSQVTKNAYATGLVSKCKYYKKSGGQSVDIEIQTNAPKISNLKMVFLNPSMLNQMGEGVKISTISDRRCIERYDLIDKFAELIFVPTSSLMITIRGWDMKNTDVVAKFAESVKWKLLEEIFP
ncbi:MAG: hypothetical protein MUC94_09310 [bacterium]|nr:hypothetical protein [bacterium]